MGILELQDLIDIYERGLVNLQFLRSSCSQVGDVEGVLRYGTQIEAAELVLSKLKGTV